MRPRDTSAVKGVPIAGGGGEGRYQLFGGSVGSAVEAQVPERLPSGFGKVQPGCGLLLVAAHAEFSQRLGLGVVGYTLLRK